MPIVVVCTACKSRFTVSDQYAGRTGPCPKCKKPITIPKPEQAVVIHEPEPAGPGQSRGGPKVSTKPLPSRDKPVAVARIAGVAGGFIAAMAAAWLAGRSFGPAGPPLPVAGAAAFAAAVACAVCGYAMVRDRELEPYRGSPLLLRATACAAVYAGLWGVRALLPVEATSEMYQWLFIAPVFFAAGALASLVAFELDWGPAVVHYGFYVIFTATLRWLAGLPPV